MPALNQQDRDTLNRLDLALGAIPGIRNPMDRTGHVTYYRDMSEVRIYQRRILAAMLDTDPAYHEENVGIIKEALKELEAFIALRRSQDWQLPERSPWSYSHYT